MYKIAILDKDKAYLERLVSFLEEHHRESFEIKTADSLDGLGAEVVQYNTLFFGDDVTVDAALFPEGVLIGYLTEKSEVSGQYINKYQSMEQIYMRMWKLCEGGKGAVSDKSRAAPEKQEVRLAGQCEWKTRTVTTNGETYRLYQVGEEQVDSLSLRMLT